MLGTSNGRTKVTETLTYFGNEVAFYRRVRNHDKRDYIRKDGRIKPDFLLVTINKYGKTSIPESDLEYAKKYHIPIIVIDADKYNEKRDKKIREAKNGQER